MDVIIGEKFDREVSVVVVEIVKSKEEVIWCSFVCGCYGYLVVDCDRNICEWFGKL